MPITPADLKLLASARMVDATDGGGQMSGATVQDGADNNVFPDLSSVNRVTGALQFRKLFPAVLQAGTDQFLGAHVVIADGADDAAVSVLLMPANGNNQTVGELTASMNAVGQAFGFCGAAVTTGIVPINTSTVPVASVRAPLVPKVTLAQSVSGNLVASGAQPLVTAWIDSGQTVALAFDQTSLTASLLFPATTIIGGHIHVASASGTFTHPTQGPGTISGTLDGSIVFTAGSYSRSFEPTDSPTDSFRSAGSPDGLTAVTATARVLVETALPQQVMRFAAVDGQVTYTLSVPTGTALQSEQLTWATGYALPGYGGRTFFRVFGTGLNFAQLDRSAGLLTLVFSAPLPTGTNIEFRYALASAASPLLSSSLVSSGLFTGNNAAVTPGGGRELAGAIFRINNTGISYALRNGIITSAAGTVYGSATGAGVITVPGNAGGSITNWYGTQIDPAFGVARADATLPTSINPTTLTITGDLSAGGAFTATANGVGVFSTAHVTGTYDPSSGALSLVFAASTKLRSLAYTAQQNLPQTVFAPMWGLDAAQFPADGTVPVLKAGQIMALRHTGSVGPATYANGNTVNMGRTGLADVRAVGANGVGILNGWSVNLATGVVTVNDISGWSQPVTWRHSIEHKAIALSVPNAGAVVLSRAVTREFPVGSVLSSALLLGDLQARVGAAFSQQAWTGVWASTRIGDAIPSQYQQAANPIVVRNDGCITERWAFVFKTATTFRLIGESLGEISAGDVNSTFAPVNPATGQPYFTVAPQGWGAWAAGNVLRVDTYGTNAPFWTARVTLPSAPSAAADSALFALMGDLNA